MMTWIRIFSKIRISSKTLYFSGVIMGFISPFLSRSDSAFFFSDFGGVVDFVPICVGLFVCVLFLKKLSEE